MCALYERIVIIEVGIAVKIYHNLYDSIVFPNFLCVLFLCNVNRRGDKGNILS